MSEVITIEITTDKGQRLYRAVALTDGNLPEGFYSTQLQEMVDVLLGSEESKF